MTFASLDSGDLRRPAAAGRPQWVRRLEAALGDADLLCLGEQLAWVTHAESFAQARTVNVLLSSATFERPGTRSRSGRPHRAHVHVGLYRSGDDLTFAGLNFHAHRTDPDRQIELGYLSATEHLDQALAEANTCLTCHRQSGYVPVTSGPVSLTRELFEAAALAHARRREHPDL